MTRKTLNLTLWLTAIIAVFLFIVWRFALPAAESAAAIELGRGEYRLQTTEGTAFTEDSLAGAPSAVFFGFTHCPLVCPTTLGDIATWQEELADSGEDLRVFFVTVDPARDRLDRLRDYVSWVPGVIGVTGSQGETDKALKAFRVYAQKVDTEDGAYSMDHSAYVLLFDDKGRFTDLISYQEDPAKALSKLRHLLSL